MKDIPRIETKAGQHQQARAESVQYELPYSWMRLSDTRVFRHRKQEPGFLFVLELLGRGIDTREKK